jgi:hypothetical protein
MCSLQQIWLNGNRLCDFNTLQFPSVTLLNLDYNPLKTDFSPAEQAKNISSVKELGLRRLHNSDAQL